MATRANTDTEQTDESEDFDFDAWSPDDEEKAIAALVPDVKHIIVEKTFIGRFTDGAIVKVPLTISLDDVTELQNEALSAVDQFTTLLTKLGGKEAAAEFTRHDLAETASLSERYFTILQRITKASLPE